MIAALDRENSACAGKFTLFNILDPGPIDSDRQIMLLLASNCASMTSDALPVVDDESVIHWKGHYIPQRTQRTLIRT
jgi:hypothetical protein